MRRRAVAALILLLAACKSSAPGGGDPSVDSGTGGDPADGAPIDPRDAGDDGCLDYVPDDWGANGPIDENQFSIDGNYTYYADMAPETEPFFQRLFISLHPEMGVFAGGDVVAGTYVLDGDELDYSWCGACVYLAVEDGETPSTLYQAQTGKLTFTITGGDIHGTLEGAELVQIDMVANGPSCADYQEGDPWPCGNSACLGSNQLCEVQQLVPACTTRFEELTF